MTCRPVRVLACLAALLLAAPAAVRAAVLSEAWYTSRIDGKRVGHHHELREVAERDGRRIVQTSLDTRLVLQRMGTELVVTSRAAFVETESGEPIRFESVNRLAASDYLIRAERVGDHFVVVQEALGKRTETEVPAAPDLMFPEAMDRAVRTRLKEPGTELELRTFSPDMARPTRVVIRCVRHEETELAGGEKRRLLRYESTQDVLPGVTLVEWRDASGDVVKTLLPVLAFEIVSLRTTRELALAEPEQVEVLVSTLVDPGTLLPRPAEVARTRFALRLKSGAPLDFAIPEDARQRVVSRSGSELVLEVRRTPWRADADAERPGAEYRRPSSVVQSDDPAVLEIALEAAPSGSPQTIARSINRWVNARVVKKSLSVGLATAAEVARDRTGDCTEHAVLAAALARARGLPARVAMGLVYVNGKLGYHMWTEVFDGGWHAIDPALGQDEPDATHIKLAASSLEQGFVDEALVGLTRVIANLDVRLLEYELDGRTVTVGSPRSNGALGRIRDGAYEHDLYGVRLEPPKGWTLVAGEAPAGPDAAGANAGGAPALVRLRGPGGETGEMRAEAVSYDFRLADWFAATFPDWTDARSKHVAVSKQPGMRYVRTAGKRSEGLLAIRSRDTLFTLRLAALGSEPDAIVDQFAGAIQIR